MEELGLNKIIEDAKLCTSTIIKRHHLESSKSQFLGPNGVFKNIMKNLASIDKNQRPTVGKKINECKNSVEKLFELALQKIISQETKELLSDVIDPSLNLKSNVGCKHILTQTKEEIIKVLSKLGFTCAEGPEIDTEWFCFDALNTPKSHPARDTHDTFFFPEDLKILNTNKHNDEKYLLRSHTSTVQIRTMLEEQPPLRIMSIGRTFRRDTVDATHSANFHQCEGLHVDKNLSVSDLKNTIDFLLKELFGGDCQTRFRPSFFPFTEPSFEVDMCVKNIGKLSGKWVEILGCGMVDPKVFEAVNYDTKTWRGYAFGIGLERIAMLRHGIDDIRLFYQNDVRFLHQFN